MKWYVMLLQRGENSKCRSCLPQSTKGGGPRVELSQVLLLKGKRSLALKLTVLMEENLDSQRSTEEQMTDRMMTFRGQSSLTLRTWVKAMWLQRNSSLKTQRTDHKLGSSMIPMEELDLIDLLTVVLRGALCAAKISRSYLLSLTKASRSLQ